MKKAVIQLLLVALLFTFAGCAPGKPANAPQQAPTPSNPTESAKALVGYPRIENLQEYIRFIETQYIPPEDFITYDMLKELGDFVNFTYYPIIDGKYYKYSENDRDFAETDARYRYLLKTPGGDRVIIKIYSANIRNSATIKALPSSIDPTQDLCRLDGANGTYSYEDIYYYYIDGTLAQVHWLEGDQIIKLIPWENNFEKHRTTNTGMISELLTLATAKPAVTTFNAQIAQARLRNAK